MTVPSRHNRIIKVHLSAKFNLRLNGANVVTCVDVGLNDARQYCESTCTAVRARYGIRPSDAATGDKMIPSQPVSAESLARGQGRETAVKEFRSTDRRRTLPLVELVGMTRTTGRTELRMRSLAVAFLSRLGSKVAMGVARVSEREGKREGAPVCATVDPRRDEMCVHGSVRSPIDPHLKPPPHTHQLCFSLTQPCDKISHRSLSPPFSNLQD